METRQRYGLDAARLQDTGRTCEHLDAPVLWFGGKAAAGLHPLRMF